MLGITSFNRVLGERVYATIIVPPRTLGCLYFKGANATEFLKRYEDLYNNVKLSKGEKAKRIPCYYVLAVG
jgi:hypothetical protein